MSLSYVLLRVVGLGFISWSALYSDIGELCFPVTSANGHSHIDQVFDRTVWDADDFLFVMAPQNRTLLLQFLIRRCRDYRHNPESVPTIFVSTQDLGNWASLGRLGNNEQWKFCKFSFISSVVPYQLLRHSYFENCCFQRSLFTGCRLYGVTFKNCDISGADFCVSKLKGVKFGSSDLTGTDFSGARICQPEDWNMNGFPVDLVKFDDCQMGNARFSNVKADTMHFQGCEMPDAYFDDGEFGNAVWNGCRLVRSDFSGTHLWCQEFNSSDFTGAKFVETRFQGFSILECALDQGDFQRSVWNGVDVVGGSMIGADFRGARIDDMTLWYTDTRCATFADACIEKLKLIGYSIDKDAQYIDDPLLSSGDSSKDIAVTGMFCVWLGDPSDYEEGEFEEPQFWYCLTGVPGDFGINLQT